MNRQLLLTFGCRASLRNEYVALRHGWSKANEAGVIVSRIEDGARAEYGLHDKGKKQAEEAAAAFSRRVAGREVAIHASDFSRTLETAEIVAAAAGAEVIPAPELRERDFGAFELGPNTAYDRVWARDAVDADHTDDGVESVTSVLLRTASLVRGCEEALADRVVLLVSHGDALQILQTAFAGAEPSAHRSLPHLETCELRDLALARPEFGMPGGG
mmetsp:Transcript_20172/g.60161  ORF Transcript_20172/g.60161 Transcript_20172/m.60161 type:complete len:216 (+) Transcript_20172:252-899(+)